jgi:hypothetical protein
MLGKLSRTLVICNIMLFTNSSETKAPELVLLLFLWNNHSHNDTVTLFKYFNYKKYLNFIFQDILVCRDCGCMEAATDNLKESITTSCPFSHTGEGAVPSGYKYEKKSISKVFNIFVSF